MKIINYNKNQVVQLISILTFPGIIIHEFSHEFFCRMLGVKVKKVCYFRFGNPAGYVIHEQSRHFFQAFFITIGPFVLGTFLATLMFWLGLHVEKLSKEVVGVWIGASIALNCFPSPGDAKSLWSENWQQIRESVWAIFGLPFTALVWVISKFNASFFRVIFAAALFWCSRLVG